MQDGPAASLTRIETTCTIAGGGPAGMMLGLLLARAGVPVAVFEKHADFLRDFRGDTIHPSTLEVLNELGYLDEFLERPHQKARHVSAYINGQEFPVADFTHLPLPTKFLAFMPQWDFLDFLAEKARHYPSFSLHLSSPVTALLTEDDQVRGLRARGPNGSIEVRAPLTIAADGRSSTVRELATLKVENLGAPMDVLWFRLSRHSSDPDELLGRFDRGRILVMIDRGDYWQCGLVIRKGTLEDFRQRGLLALKQLLVEISPFLHDRVDELANWDDLKLLTVTVDRLPRWWKPGLLCIGDAAHAMSPVGGVGINLALQDAVAAANILAPPLLRGSLTTSHLARVQKRRWFPTVATQRLQLFLQNRVIEPSFDAQTLRRTPWPLRLLSRYPRLQRIPARLIGIGLRPEHVRNS